MYTLFKNVVMTKGDYNFKKGQMNIYHPPLAPCPFNFSI